jgi:cobalt-zinc-cadmium efflux system outer membrane protein
MKTFSAFLCSFLLAAASDAAPPGKTHATAPLTLSAATQLALTNNRSIREARARWRSMKARVPQAAAWDDLKISASTRLGRFVDIAPNGFTDQMFSVEQMIPISGRNQSRARIAAAEALGGLEEFRRREIDVVMKVRIAYIRLSNGYAQLDLNRAADVSLFQTREITRSKFEVGAQSQAEALAAEAESIRISEARHDLERSISDEETQLKVLMNIDAFAALGRPADDLPKHAPVAPERLRGLVLSNRPELRMAQAKVAAARAGVELAKREWIPDPTLSVQAQRYNDASQAVSEVSAGISFSVPWLNGKKYRAEEREAQAGAEAAQDALEASQAEALGMLRDQLKNIDTLHHHVELFRDRLLPNARQTVETMRTGYEGDKTSFLDLVASQRRQWEVESMARQHLADYQVALAELEAIVGADLHLFSRGQELSKGRSK